MPDYTVSLQKFGITKAEFQELDGFCQQYHDKKRMLRQWPYQETGSISPAPRERRINNPTLRNTIRRERFSRDCQMIEDAARQSAPGYAAKMLDHVTRHTSYQRLCPPCGRRQFLQSRRLFYVSLYEMRNSQ